MKGIVRVTLTATLFLTLVSVGCSSSKDPARIEGMDALERMQSAVQNMSIVVSVGVTKDEYSTRLTDALLKFGDRGEGCKQAVAKFPEGREQSTAAEACQQLSRAMDAYTSANGYIGPKPDPIAPDLLSYTLTQDEYTEAKKQFSNLEALPVAETNESGYKFYDRSAMVQGLWKVAAEDDMEAKQLINRLSSRRG